MQSLKTLLLALAAFMFASQNTLAAGQQRLGGAEFEGYDARALTLSLENGFGGILSIQYFAVLPDKNGRVTYVLFTDPKQYTPFAGKVSEAEGFVIADLDGTGLSVRLMATTGGARLYGHVVETSDRVIVVPATPRNIRDFRNLR